MRKTFFIWAVLLGTFVSLSCHAPVMRTGEWRFIADKWVNFGVDRDVILFGDLRDDFTKLKLRVTNAPVRFLDMKIYYDNGDVQDVALRAVIPQGGESRVIDLVGGVRHLKKIEFWYKPGARGRKGRARVAVWGRL
jgi:hypothetical protein